ncbi:MAG: acyl-CoA dehydrogenase [Acetobacteraceae bacterium]|nr:acyl-CoA dehydrogenase [Acetobacteraceae bacterium]
MLSAESGDVMGEAEDIDARVAGWLADWPAPSRTGLAGMAEAGLLSVGVEGPRGYSTIARTKETLNARTGLLGLSGAWGARQMAARFFVGGFGTAEQRGTLLPRLTSGAEILAVAISEPGIGAHPKHLATRAVAEGDRVRITGEKTWVSNGPEASVFLVFAVTSDVGGRKQFGAFLVPRDAPGLILKEMAALHALRPAGHCGVSLMECVVPASARLGPDGTAFAAMAMPFRDVEDAVGAPGLLGIFHFLLARLANGATAADESLGGLAALVAVFGHAAYAPVHALDAGSDDAATLAGLRLLAVELLARFHAHRQAFLGPADAALERALADLEVMLSVARGPRAIRQARLGAALRASRG